MPVVNKTYYQARVFNNPVAEAERNFLLSFEESVCPGRRGDGGELRIWTRASVNGGAIEWCSIEGDEYGFSLVFESGALQFQNSTPYSSDTRQATFNVLIQEVWVPIDTDGCKGLSLLMWHYFLVANALAGSKIPSYLEQNKGLMEAVPPRYLQ